MEHKNLCMGCMADTGGAEVCPTCQWKEGTPPESPVYLVPRTALQEQYLIGRVLGHGGFGITYLGWDLNLARKIAIKEYFPAGIAMRAAGNSRVTAYSGGLQTDFQWGLDRYLDEARVLARFDHPNISSVLNFFRANGTAYMILDFLDGMTFEKLLERRGGRIPWDTLLQIAVPVMDALREVHKFGILHRDISPDNVYVLRTGQIKVIDFGAARYALGQQSKNLSIILKEGYAPEEQYRSKGNQGPWTDVYATAATMYRALTSRIPPPALDRQRGDELEPPSALGVALPPGKEAVLLKALAVEAVDRFQDMASFEKAVLTEPAAGPVAIPAPTDQGAAVPAPDPVMPPIAPPPPKPGFPKWLVAAGAAVIAIVGLVVAKTTGGAPVIKTFEVVPASIAAGTSASLSWQVEDAESVTISPSVGTDRPAGTTSVHPTQTTTYTITARSKSGKEVTRDVELAVTPPPAPAIGSFQAAPSSIRAGEATVLSWSVRDAVEVTINGQKVPSEGRAQVKPASSMTYVLVARAADGSAVKNEVNVTVAGQAPVADNRPAPVQIVAFAFVPAVIQSGQSTRLHWSVRGATSVEIEGLGRVPPGGERQFSASRTSTIKLLARGEGGSATGSATVTVVPAPPRQEKEDRPVTGPTLAIAYFTASPLTVQPGGAAQLSWSAMGADAVFLSPAPGRVPPVGQVIVNPLVSSRYTLTAVNPAGQRVSRDVTIVVTPYQSDRRDVPRPAPRLTWTVMHDHDGLVGSVLGRLGKIRQLGQEQPWRYCQGQLTVANGRLQYVSAQFPAHNFDVPLAAAQLKPNRGEIRGYPSFEVKLDGGHYNFACPTGVTAIMAAIESGGR